VCRDGTGFVVLEARRYTTSRLNKKAVASLAWTIRDTGARGGLIVSPLGLQAGAQALAGSQDIVAVHLSAESTTADYVLSFLGEVMFGKADGLQVSASLLGGTLTVVTPQNEA